MKNFFDTPYKLAALFLVLFSVGLGLGSFGYSKLFLKNNVTTNRETQIVTNSYPLPPIIEEKRETTKNARVLNFLLMGHGGAGHSGGGLMDSIIVVSVNITDKKAGLVSIPRDLYFSGHKINSDPSIKDAVTHVTGLSINNTISIDFDNFIKMIDSLGGITVDVKKAYTDNFYPIRGKENELCGFSSEKVEEVHKLYSGFELEKQFTCRYETISYPVGLNNMNGSDALKYVRSRHGGSDFTRSQHQFEVLKAILQKTDIYKIKDVFSLVKTDLNLEKIDEYLTKIGNPLEYSISSLQLSEENVLVSGKSRDGAYILLPKLGEGKYEAIKKFVYDSI